MNNSTLYPVFTLLETDVNRQGQRYTHTHTHTQTWTNQSMVQQLTREGNIRQRDLKASPTGLMQSTMCSFSRTREMKNWNTWTTHTHTHV